MRPAQLGNSVLMFVLLLGLLSAGCHKNVSALPVAPISAAPPPLPPTIALTADRTVIAAGQAVTLTWQSTNATTVMLDNAIGNVSTNGSRQVSPQTSTSYTATAQGAGGTAASQAVRVTVNVTPRLADAAPAPATRPEQPVRTPTLAEQFQTAMQSIFFDYDQYVIRNSEIPRLRAMGKWLLTNPAVRFTIEGNADERGSQEYNIALGDERAAAVQRFLAAEGVSGTRMNTQTNGEERPVCRELTEDCWQKNRRAQFVLKP